MKLPPANAEPFDELARSERLGAARRRFLDSQIDGRPVFHILKTHSKVDVGTWFFKRRVWACLLGDELLLFARGRQPYVERVPFDRLQRSEYNHVTGEVMLAPADGLRVGHLKMPPLEGLHLLAHIHRGKD